MADLVQPVKLTWDCFVCQRAARYVSCKELEGDGLLTWMRSEVDRLNADIVGVKHRVCWGSEHLAFRFVLPLQTRAPEVLHVGA